jgi:hypothetical protein
MHQDQPVLLDVLLFVVLVLLSVSMIGSTIVDRDRALSGLPVSWLACLASMVLPVLPCRGSAVVRGQLGQSRRSHRTAHGG